MQTGITREMIESVVSEAFSLEIHSNRKKVNQLKKFMSEFGIGLADTQRIISNKTPLENISDSVLCLLLLGLSKTIDDYDLKIKSNPMNYFTENEIKEAKLQDFSSSDPDILPYTFENVTQFELDDYDTSIHAQQLLTLIEGNIIQYNFDTQREAKILKSSKTPTGIIRVPKLNEKSVKEMTDLIIEGKLFRTVITFNARLNSSDTGQELIYDTKNRTLTVTEGTKLDCLDGFHRLTATINALKINPGIKMTFGLRVVNYSTKKAQSLFSQINTFTSQSISRLAEMRQSQSSYVVKQLREECIIGDKISSSDVLVNDQLVSFNVLDSVIDEVFNPENIIEAKKAVEYLKEAFDAIALGYPEEFVTNILQTKKKTLINSNQMFYAYVIMAKRLKDKDLPANDILKFVEQVDFSRDNQLWEDLGILDAKKNITTNPKNKIKKYFRNLIFKEEIDHV
ncbi:DNA sulfur modification protein DndB [Brevibacillus daliensis]|uniref:DNA sulfur modification protein DndB n=1 Tax=Brevibacillus daliensis TaxID=2892995 RepID=UPI001E4F528B|nr:DNA sulfur modification protein DndB [Brevibacillus daliensis]